MIRTSIVKGQTYQVFLSGDDKEEILHIYYSYYNHEATNGSFYWLNDNMGYFYAPKGMFEKGVLNIESFKLDEEEVSNTAKENARKKLEEIFSNAEKEYGRGNYIEILERGFHFPGERDSFSLSKEDVDRVRKQLQA